MWWDISGQQEASNLDLGHIPIKGKKTGAA
jgi:hypothetical protein